jgi:2-haloacid dehalogenase
MQRAVVFDLGGVLIDWDPRYLYRTLLDDEETVEHFLATVCTPAWNEQQDAGRTLAEGTAELIAQHPEYGSAIEAFYGRWPEMLAGTIAGSVEVLAALRDRSVPLYALTNWSAETFPYARERFDFLTWFEAILVSGEEGIKKPDPAFFQLLFERQGLAPEASLFVDDSERNVAAARAVGMEAVHFTSAERLRAELSAHGLL